MFLSDILKINGGKLLLNINMAIKVRIYPTVLQRELLNKTFGCCRFLWNQMLAERKFVYQQLKKNPESLKNYKYKTEKEYKREFKFMKEVDSKALQSTTRHLLEAFQNFFKGRKKTQKAGFTSEVEIG